MTFADLQAYVANRLNLTSTTALDRIGVEINDRYKQVTSSIGLALSRRITAQANASLGSTLMTFPSVTKIFNVVDRTSMPYRVLREVTIEELRANQPSPNSFVTFYAIESYATNSVTIEMDCIAQSTFTLYADGLSVVTPLSGTTPPAFPEDYHDVIYQGVLADEYRKMEKWKPAAEAEARFEKRLSDLRYFISKSGYSRIVQNGRRDNMFIDMLGGGASSGSGSGSVNGAASYTQTGLITFDRSGSGPGWIPFTVAAGAAAVPNLIASEAVVADSLLGGVPDTLVAFTDNATSNVSSTKHGYAPKSPANASTFLNGDTSPSYQAVKDSDLSVSDIATNNVSAAAHGFAPKTPNDVTKFLDGTGNYSVPPVTDFIYLSVFG